MTTIDYLKSHNSFHRIHDFVIPTVRDATWVIKELGNIAGVAAVCIRRWKRADNEVFKIKTQPLIQLVCLGSLDLPAVIGHVSVLWMERSKRSDKERGHIFEGVWPVQARCAGTVMMGWVNEKELSVLRLETERRHSLMPNSLQKHWRQPNKENCA